MHPSGALVKAQTGFRGTLLERWSVIRVPPTLDLSYCAQLTSIDVLTAREHKIACILDLGVDPTVVSPGAI